jgi:hypothetical protein
MDINKRIEYCARLLDRTAVARLTYEAIAHAKVAAVNCSRRCLNSLHKPIDAAIDLLL